MAERFNLEMGFKACSIDKPGSDTEVILREGRVSTDDTFTLEASLFDVMIERLKGAQARASKG